MKGRGDGRAAPRRRPVLAPRARRVVVAAVAGIVGLVGGGAAGLGWQGRTGAMVLGPAAPPPRSPAVRAVAPDTLLAWTPGGLPAGFARRVSRLPGVRHVVAVAGDTVWLTRSFAAGGPAVDAAPPGLAYPLEMAAADPGAFAPFLPPADRRVLPVLAAGEAVLGASSARLRRLGPGGVLAFGGYRVRVGAVLPDAEVGASEVFVSRRTAASLGAVRERYLLIDPSPDASRERLSAAIRALLPPGHPVQIRGPGETPYFRQGDAVLPPVRLKLLFGEFAARPLPGGYLEIDPAWVASHVVTASVPILGPVRCNRALIPQLRAALGEVAASGSSAIDPGDYGGCFSPRFTNRHPSAGISHHSWGVAVDLNVSRNAFGHTPHQDPRMVATFERWGFTWGGRWVVPDGMHVEFARFPPAS